MYGCLRAVQFGRYDCDQADDDGKLQYGDDGGCKCWKHDIGHVERDDDSGAKRVQLYKRNGTGVEQHGDEQRGGVELGGRRDVDGDLRVWLYGDSEEWCQFGLHERMWTVQYRRYDCHSASVELL